MTIAETRRKNLIEFVNKYRNLRDFATSNDIDYSNLYQVIKGNRAFGEVLARKIEEKLELQPGALDKQAGAETSTFKIAEYGVKLSAGLGEEVITPENIVKYHVINDSFLQEFQVKQENLAIVSIVGNSMEPTLRDGEKVIVDISRKEVIDNRIFAITTKNHTWAKRLRITPVGEKWQSDNEEYREYDDALNCGKTTVRLVGLVLYSLGRQVL